MSCGCKWQTKLAPYQSAVVERATSACRNQFGLLLLHQMGSGKTMVALSILHNLPKDKVFTMLDREPGLIIAPAGIEDGFEYDSSWTCADHMDDNVRPSKDIQQLFPDRQKASDLRRRYEIMTIKYKEMSDYDSFEEALEGRYSVKRSAPGTDYRMRASAPESLADKMRNRYVIVDEAHNLIRYMRAKTSNLNTIVQAFRGARRVVLMTGTPMQRERSDITLLFNLVYKPAPGQPILLPYTNALFDSVFYKLPPLSGNVVLYAKDLANQFARFATGKLTSYAVGSTGAALSSLTRTALMNAGWPVPDGPIGSAVDFAIGATLGTVASELINQSYSPLTILSKYLKTYDPKEITPQFLELASSLCSFFDYEVAKPDPTAKPGTDGSKKPSVFFPRRQIFPIQVLLTKKQQQSILTLQFKDDEQKPLRLQEVWDKLNAGLDDPTQLMGSYVDAGLKLGNSADDDLGPMYTPRLYKNLGPLQRSFYVEGADAELFRCPKFDAAYAILKQIRRGGRNGIFCATGVTEKGQFVTRIVRDPVTDEVIRDKTRVLLPVVWSNFVDEGFKSFGAYLSARKEKYLVFLPEDTVEQRLALMREALKTYSVDRGVGSDYLCILLHPDITEGISFTYNPALIALETIKGYGVQEQVYGRVLRRYNAPFNTPAQSDKTREIKYIFQMSSGYYETGSVDDDFEFHLHVDNLRDWLALHYDYIKNNLSLYANYKALVPGYVSGQLNFVDANPEGIQLMWNSRQAAIMRKVFVKLQDNDDATVVQKCLTDQRLSQMPCKVCIEGSCDCFAEDVPLCNQTALAGGRRRSGRKSRRRSVKRRR